MWWRRRRFIGRPCSFELVKRRGEFCGHLFGGFIEQLRSQFGGKFSRQFGGEQFRGFLRGFQRSELRSRRVLAC